MNRKSVFRTAMALLTVAGISFSGIQPAQAVTKTEVTIWSYGNVIEPWGEQEYERLHPNIDLKIKKNSMDAHH
ncbi:MAG: hypothetical protein RL545_696, partial [Actinomycetota bacterium]